MRSPVRSRPIQAALLAFAVALTTGAAKPPAKPIVKQAKPTPVIQSIAWRDVGLVLQSSQPLDPQIFTLEKPYRFVVDLPDADLAEPALAHPISVHAGSVEGVRLSRKSNGTVRMVIDCKASTRFQVMQLAGRTTLVVARAEEANTALASLLSTSAAEHYTGAGQELRKLWARERADGLDLTVEAGKPLTYKLFADDPTHLELRIPAGRYTGFLPLPGKWLAGARVRTLPDGTWVLDTAMTDGCYTLEQTTSPDHQKLTLGWTRNDPHRFPGRPLVVIDPGHGGNDPGALGPGGGLEKADCLALATALEHALWSHQINAVMTRSTDAEMYLEPRLRMIDQVHADYFVSLHANSHTTPDSTGTESFWREPASREFATTIQEAMTTLLHRPDRGVKQEHLYVLRNPRVPSVLLESGFISNPGEEKMLASRDFQARAAEAITAGVERYMARDHNPALGLVGPSLGSP